MSNILRVILATALRDRYYFTTEETGWMICLKSLNQCLSHPASAVRVHTGKNSLGLSHEGFHAHAQAGPSCVGVQGTPPTELWALVLNSFSLWDNRVLPDDLRAKSSPWGRTIQLRQDVPRHPGSSSQAELQTDAKGSWGWHGHP